MYNMRTHEEFCSEIFERKKSIIKRRREQKRIIVACSSFAIFVAIVISARVTLDTPGGGTGEQQSPNSPAVDLPEVDESNSNRPPQIENPSHSTDVEEEKYIEDVIQPNDNYQSNISLGGDESEEETDSSESNSDAENQSRRQKISDTLYSTSHPMLEAGEDPYPYIPGIADGSGENDYPAAPPILDAEDDPYPSCSE